jgi:Ca-activated chloride channel family protein
MLGYSMAQEAADETGQDQAGDEGFRIGVAVNQVYLSVNARHVTGGFAKGLQREDFLVFEDGVLQEIVNFNSEKVPVKVVLLIDASGSTRFSQGEIQRAALEFARRLSDEDRVSIITFNHNAKLIRSWTNDLERVERALKSIYAKGATVLNDAVYVTFDDLLAEVDGKTAVILLTDGIDTGSMVSYEEAVNLALRSESMVYVVSKLEEYWAQAIAYRAQQQAFGRYIPRELTDDFILSRKRALQRLADLTGGRVLEEKSFASLVDVYTQVAEELRNQYYLSYIPTNSKRDGSWRNIEVRARRADVVLRTRQGYFAQGGTSLTP